MRVASLNHSSVGAPNRVLVGFIVAPMVATAAALFTMVALSGTAPSENVVTAAAAIAAVGYACELLFGVPLYFVFRRESLARAWHFLCLGSTSGGLFALPMAWIMFPARDTSLLEGFVALSTRLVPFGAIIGLTLW